MKKQSVYLKLLGQAMDDPNVMGELLRSYCFVPDKYGGDYGCYSTFDLRSEFKEIDKNSELGRKLLKVLGFDPKEYKRLRTEPGVYARYDAEMMEQTYEGSRLYSDGEIHLGWYWDGDGCLVFILEDFILENSDCKKDYEWRFVNDDGSFRDS